MTRTLAGLFDSMWYRGHPLRWLLWPFAQLFRGAVSVRRSLYRFGVLKSIRLDVPVIVVGNLSVGGTGKTPLVIWLAQRLRERGYRPGIVSRGYRGKGTTWPQEIGADSDPNVVGDEPVLLARRAGCPVAAGPNRIQSAKLLIKRHGINVLLTDDGLQHYRLMRDVEVAVVDGLRGLGNELCLPAGPLREPKSRLRNVDAIVVNGGDWGHSGVFRAAMAPVVVRQTTTGATKKLSEFKGLRVHAVAGIAHPERFFELLEEHDLLVETHPLPDHAQIRAADLEFGKSDIVMITEKDEVKCKEIAHAGVWCLVAELQFSQSDAVRLMRTLLRQLG